MSEVDREATALLLVMAAFDHQVQVIEVRREVMERCLEMAKGGRRRRPAPAPVPAEPAVALFG